MAQAMPDAQRQAALPLHRHAAGGRRDPGGQGTATVRGTLVHGYRAAGPEVRRLGGPWRTRFMEAWEGVWLRVGRDGRVVLGLQCAVRWIPWDKSPRNDTATVFGGSPPGLISPGTKCLRKP